VSHHSLRVVAVSHGQISEGRDEQDRQGVITRRDMSNVITKEGLLAGERFLREHTDEFDD
jgi:hypothetical protein